MGLFFSYFLVQRRTVKTDNLNNDLLNQGFIPCENGMAGSYPCNGYDLLAQIPLKDFDATSGNDIWGWIDPSTDKEYAVFGLNNGTAFIDITDTENIIYLGKLQTASESSSWRDVKVYKNHAFIVADDAGNHGMQVFDLTKLRNVTNAPVDFTEDATFNGFSNAHNVVINEQSGYAYVVGTDRNDALCRWCALC